MKRKGKRIIGWMLLLAMVFGSACMVSCGRAENDSGEAAGVPEGRNDEENRGSAENLQQEGLAEGEKAMGRYLEKVDDSLKEELNAGSKIAKMEDGSLVIMSARSGKWVSADNGITWEKEKIAWFEKLKADGAWIMEIAVAEDGSAALIYAGNPESGEEDGGQENVQDFHPQYGFVSPDGVFTPLDVPYKSGEYINYLAFAGDGRLFGSALGGKVYEMDKSTGAVKEVAELPGAPNYMVEKDGNLLLVHAKGITVVDLSGGEVTEDKVLDEFLQDQFGGRIDYNTEGVRPLLVMPGSGGVVYVAFDKGIYRHVIGGNVMEQVADGALTSLSNPSYGISDGILLENDEFLILFSSGEILRYTYDPDMPAVPKIQLTAYSLRESAQLKAVISQYQSEHPEAYIRYEIGMEDNFALTREDALKKLNTEIAAGKGPDFFILDDMPIDSYKEKGVLADLTPYLQDKAEDQYFSNVLHAFKGSEGIYAVPSQFQAALVVGRKEDIEKMADLEAMAGIVEQYREEKAEGLILGARNEDELLNLLMPVCAPSWKDKEGKINKNELVKFYTLAKRIWDAEEAGLDEDAREDYKQFLTDMRVSGIESGRMREILLSVSGKMIEYSRGEIAFAAGLLQHSSGFDIITSFLKMEEWADKSFAAYNGQSGGVFMPRNLIGISNTCVQKEEAVELMEKMLDDDALDGMPVNKEKYRENFRKNDQGDGSSYCSMGASDADGSKIYALDLYAASEADVERLMRIVEESRIPYVRDPVLEDAVYEIGGKVMRGEISPSSGAEEVMQKTSIYMAE